MIRESMVYYALGNLPPLALTMPRALAWATNVVGAIQTGEVLVALAPRVVATNAIIIALVHAFRPFTGARIHSTIQPAITFNWEFCATAKTQPTRRTYTSIEFYIAGAMSRARLVRFTVQRTRRHITMSARVALGTFALGRGGVACAMWATATAFVLALNNLIVVIRGHHTFNRIHRRGCGLNKDVLGTLGHVSTGAVATAGRTACLLSI